MLHERLTDTRRISFSKMREDYNYNAQSYYRTKTRFFVNLGGDILHK